MVEDSGAPARADGVRPLNQPRPITVVASAGRPVALIEGGRRRRVATIQDSWQIDDEWWREPISRRYYLLLLEDGVVRTVYHDLISGAWFAQGY